MIFITRFRLYARTCKLISALTLGSRRHKKWVAPIQALIVPNVCSTVRLRTVISVGSCSSRACIRSSTASCSQRVKRRYLSVVHFARSAQRGQADDQYLWIIKPFISLANRWIAYSPAGHR